MSLEGLPSVPGGQTSAILTRGLTKRYGSFTALDSVDLDVPAGSIFGFLGPNGAGKTTTLRILTGLARATAGEVRVFGDEAGSSAARSRVGFLPDVPGFYDWMTAEEYLRFAGGLFGLDGPTLDGRVDTLLEMAGLADATARVGGFSRGMRQRLGVAQALVNAPQLLLLDEPTSALDPLGRRELLEMIAALKGRTTVFFSTHILSDVERVCDTVAILDRGRLVEQASIAALKERYAAHRLIVEVESGASGLAAALREQQWCNDVAVDGATVTMTVTDVDAARRAIPEIVAARSLALVSFDSGEISLEEVFVGLVSPEEVAS